MFNEMSHFLAKIIFALENDLFSEMRKHQGEHSMLALLHYPMWNSILAIPGIDLRTSAKKSLEPFKLWFASARLHMFYRLKKITNILRNCVPNAETITVSKN